MASDSKSNARPLSPFTLGVYYRWQISSALSILHRATGVALSVGALVFVYWLASAAAGPESYARAQGILGSFLVQLLMIGWVWSLWYHFLNGIRHLGWD